MENNSDFVKLKSYFNLSIPVWFLLDLKLRLDSVVTVGCRLPGIVPLVGVKVGAGVGHHRLVGIVQRLLLDSGRRDRLGYSAFLHLSRLICNKML